MHSTIKKYSTKYIWVKWSEIQAKTLIMKIYFILSLFIIIHDILSCPKQNVDIHNFLKQKQAMKDAPDILNTQPVKNLIPLHHQMKQESESIKEFMLLLILTNTASFLCLFGIFWICRCGVTYITNVTRELQTLRSRELQDAAANPWSCNVIIAKWTIQCTLCQNSK